ncbi:unnamed protein product [Closterium sp. NIES-65]|nr:unnamed protein product [Closterium sp. NIES-65]
MDPSVRRDPELEGSAESSLPQPAPAGPRPRLPAHPSASEPVHHFERVQTLPHRPAARPASPEYSWAPARVASNRPDGQPRQERGCSPLRHPQQPPSPRRPSPERRPALTASAIPRATFSSAISGDAGEGVAWQARASGAPTHVHIEVTNGPPFAADPGQVAPLRAPTLREYQPAREGRAQFRTPRQVPGFSAPRLAVGRTPGWPAAFPREAQTAPLPTRAGRDPMLTMCRVLNLAEACEVVANLQLAVCGAMRSFPSSFALVYRHELGMNYARVLPNLIVGSCLQASALACRLYYYLKSLSPTTFSPLDLDHLRDVEGVGAVQCLQRDSDLDYFDLDINPIIERAAERGDIRHLWTEISCQGLLHATALHLGCPIFPSRSSFPFFSLSLEPSQPSHPPRSPRDFDPFDLRMQLPRAVAALHKAVMECGTAYVHCTAGLGRAPAVAVRLGSSVCYHCHLRPLRPILFSALPLTPLSAPLPIYALLPLFCSLSVFTPLHPSPPLSTPAPLQSSQLAYMWWMRDLQLEEANEILQLTGNPLEQVEINWRNRGVNETVEVAGLDVGWHHVSGWPVAALCHVLACRWLALCRAVIGTYYYKHIVNGTHWSYNPDAPLTPPDRDYNVNNYIEVVGSSLDPAARDLRKRIMQEGAPLTQEDRAAVVAKIIEIAGTW